MTRSELVQKILMHNPSITLAQAEECVSVILEEITAALAKRNRVELRGFGIFTVRDRDARIGRNPRTGQTVNVEAKSVPFFKAGKELRNRLNS